MFSFTYSDGVREALRRGGRVFVFQRGTNTVDRLGFAAVLLDPWWSAS